MRRQTKTITLYESCRYSNTLDKLPSRVQEFIAWLEALISSVPEEDRSAIEIEFDDDGDYDSPSPQLRITYSRLETDAEMNERLDEDAERRAQQARALEAKDRAEYARLKVKFEGKT